MTVPTFRRGCQKSISNLKKKRCPRNCISIPGLVTASACARPIPAPLHNGPGFLTNGSPKMVSRANIDVKMKNRIHHSVCRWCYDKIPLDDLCRAVKEMGLTAIDLIDPPDFSVLKKHGLVCSMVSFPNVDGIGTIPKAFNRLEHHDILTRIYEQRLRD